MSHWAAAIGCAIATTVAVAPLPASAQTQAQQDRLNRVGQFVVVAPMCEMLGMKLDPDLPAKAEKAIDAEVATWGIDRARGEQLKNQAVTRQGAMLKTDLEAAADDAKTDEQLRALKGTLLGYGRTCVIATTDPIFSSLIVPPPGYDLDQAATNAADSMLEAGGLASWQTPQIQARGDLIMLAGSCRSRIGASRSDALVKQYGQSDDSRVRDYYSQSFDEGLADPSIISTLAGCNRAIAANVAKLR